MIINKNYHTVFPTNNCMEMQLARPHFLIAWHCPDGFEVDWTKRQVTAYHHDLLQRYRDMYRHHPLRKDEQCPTCDKPCCAMEMQPIGEDVDFTIYQLFVCSRCSEKYSATLVAYSILDEGEVS